MIRNLEQLQADVGAMAVDNDLSSSGNSSLNVNLTKPYLFDSEDDEAFLQQTTSRKISSGSGTSSGTNVYLYERDRPSPVLEQRSSAFPFDAFGVCAAEADILKQVQLNDSSSLVKKVWHVLFVIHHFILFSTNYTGNWSFSVSQLDRKEWYFNSCLVLSVGWGLILIFSSNSC